MTPEQQRKILEAAAKACGIDLEFRVLMWSDGSTYPCYEDKSSVSTYAGHTPVIKWNPLTNAIDTAEMCAKLGIGTYWPSKLQFVDCLSAPGTSFDVRAEFKDHDNSRLKAWMFAATMVAAKIEGYEE